MLLLGMYMNNILSNSTCLKCLKDIDVYVNYQCGLRCSHCFIGNSLNENVQMKDSLWNCILGLIAESSIEQVTFLGGEPSLHTNIVFMINDIVSLGKKVRIVTNGQKSFIKVIKDLRKVSDLAQVHVCFSIDGSTEDIHDSIRGKGVYKNLINSILLCQEMKISFSGITSIFNRNFLDVTQIIKKCSELKFEYLNVHYVTDRGFADNSMLISIRDWTNMIKEIKSLKKISDAILPIRIEETFVSDKIEVKCEVNKKENIIIDPHGEIHFCTMFMSITNSFCGIIGTDGVFHLNESHLNQVNTCSDCSSGCPALPKVNNSLYSDAKSAGLKIDCIFNKTLFS